MSDSEGQSTPSSSLIEDAVCLEADEVIKGSSRDKIRWKLRWKRGGLCLWKRERLYEAIWIARGGNEYIWQGGCDQHCERLMKQREETNTVRDGQTMAERVRQRQREAVFMVKRE